MRGEPAAFAATASRVAEQVYPFRTIEVQQRGQKDMGLQDGKGTESRNLRYLLDPDEFRAEFVRQGGKPRPSSSVPMRSGAPITVRLDGTMTVGGRGSTPREAGSLPGAKAARRSRRAAQVAA
jgi:hypothetical protein